MSSKRAIRNRHRRRACDGKVKHPDQARAVAAMIRYKRAFPGDKVSSYKCDHCGNWHFGHRRR